MVGQYLEENDLSMVINPNAKFQITKLDHETPLFSISDNASMNADPESATFSNLSAIDGQIYQTSWSKIIGTELIFDDYGNLIGTVRERLVADTSVSVKQKEAKEHPGEGGQTSFFKKAIKLAEQRRNKRIDEANDVNLT